MTESDEIVYIRYLEKRKNDDLKILLERYRESLTLFLRGIVNNQEDAEELMLDAFAEAAVREHWKKEGASFKTWLFSVARNLAYAYLRKNRRRADLRDDVFDDGARPDEAFFARERDRTLYEALDALPPDYRQTLYLLFFEEMSVEAAAKVMRKSKKQIYNLTARGKAALKEELTRRGYGDAYSV